MSLPKRFLHEPDMSTVAKSVQLLQVMQSHGLEWMRNVRTREQVVQSMHYYLTRAGLDAAAVPPIIHIAGTKGKGSTAAMTESMLRAAGLRTGLFTSPHLVSVTERFRLNGVPVSEAAYLDHFFSLWERIGDTAAGGAGAAAAAPFASLPPLPGFNFLTLLALRLFVESRVDVLILETGLGGRLDATNMFDAPTVAVTGITTLDFDHTETLGETLPLIASEKAGIFKAGMPALTVPQRADAMEVLVEIAAARGAPLYHVDAARLAARTPDGRPPALGIGGRFQAQNSALAVALVEVFVHQRAQKQESARAGGSGRRGSDSGLQPLDTFGASHRGDGRGVYDATTPLPPWMLSGLANATWPGRAEVLHLPGTSTRLHVDGAHTGRSMIEAVGWYAGGVGGGVPAPGTPRPLRILLFTCGQDKDALSLLLPLSVLPWDAVFMCGVEWTLTRKAASAALTPDTALATFLEKRRRMGDEAAIEDIRTALGGELPPPSSPEEAAVVPPAQPLDYQRALASLFTHVYTAREYAVHRRRLLPLARGDAGAALGEGERVEVEDSPLPPSPPTPVVLPSLEAALEAISRLDTQGRGAEVMVTGSLYLVGAALSAVERRKGDRA
jgi:folylpolyglutamate synthase